MSCSLNATSFTEDDLIKIYPNQGLLPSPLLSDSDRENGMLKPDAVKTIIQNLKSSGIIPALTSTNAEAFFTNQKNLLENIKSEYCYYYSMYAYCLQKLLKSISDGYLNTANSNTITTYLNHTQMLNKKMNDLIQIINGVSEEMLQSSSIMATEIKKFDNEASQLKLKLTEQNRIISSSDAVTKLNKEMVKYTEEKNRYTENLLKTYSVLNIVALGLLIYIYKST